MDEIDHGLYNNRPERKRAELISSALKHFASLRAAHKVQDVITPSSTHRIEFEQMGRIPDMEECMKSAPSDGRYMARAAWMDGNGIGHIYLAWKEKPAAVPTGTAESVNISISNPIEGGKA